MNQDATNRVNADLVDGADMAGVGQAGMAGATSGPSGSDVETVSTIPSGVGGAGVGRPANTYESQVPAAGAAGGATGGQITPGTEVFDAGGETVGNLLSYDPAGGRMVVRKGWLFSQDTELPIDAIGDTGASGIYLRQTVAELRQQYSDRLASDDMSGQGVGAGATTAQTGATGAYDTADTATMGTVETVQAQPAQGSVVTGTAGTGMQAAGYDTAQTAQTAGYDTAQQTTTDTGDIRVPVYEEELVVGKRQEEAGRVRLHKEVEAEQQSIPVTLQREQVTVERVPVDQAVDPGTVGDAFQGGDIEVPVMGEEAVVGKQVRAVEEVRLSKQAVEEQEQVSDTVRRERVVVDGVDDTQGNVVAGDQTTYTDSTVPGQTSYTDTTR